MTLTSPLRYPGSKRQLSRYVQDVLELNELHPTLYVEPFVGGASAELRRRAGHPRALCRRASARD